MKRVSRGPVVIATWDAGRVLGTPVGISRSRGGLLALMLGHRISLNWNDGRGVFEDSVAKARDKLRLAADPQSARFRRDAVARACLRGHQDGESPGSCVRLASKPQPASRKQMCQGARI